MEFLDEKAGVHSSQERSIRERKYKITLRHVQLSPYAEQVEVDTLAWMHQCHLIDDEVRRDRVLKMEIGKYAGYACPFFNYLETLNFAKYITLWLLWDDFVVERSDAESSIENNMRDAFLSSASLSKDSDPYTHAWQAIVSEYRVGGASDDFIERLYCNMFAWMQAAAAERASAVVSCTDGFQAFVDRRIITIGMIPTAQLLELCVREKIPQSSFVENMVLESSKIVAFSNELASVEKDENWINLVNIYRQINCCSEEDAYLAIISRHDKAVKNINIFTEAASGEIQKWAKTLQYCAEGFSYWQTICKRYSRSKVYCDRQSA